MTPADFFFAALYLYLMLLCVKHSVDSKGPARSVSFVAALLVIPSAAFIHLKGRWDLSPTGPLNDPSAPWVVRIAGAQGGEPHHVNVILSILVLSLIFTAATLAVALFTRIYDRRGARVHPIYKPFIKWGIVLTGALLYLGLSGISLSGLFIGMGAASLVAGFALQETLANLVTGVSLEMEGVVRPGNWIKPESGAAGRVLSKGLRATTIRTITDETLVIPNKSLAGGPLTAYGAGGHPSARTLEVCAAYSEAPLRVKEILRQILLDDPRILQSPEPSVLVAGFGESSIVYRLLFRLSDYGTFQEVEDSILTRVWYAFAADGVDIPFPARTLYLHTAEDARKRAGERGEANSALADFLGSIAPLADHLGRAELAYLAANASLRSHLPGEKVVERGEAGDSVYFVRSGWCEVRLPNGESKRLGAGEFFGEMALFNRGLRSADVRGGPEGAELARIGREPILTIFRSHPGLETAFALSHQTRAVEAGLHAAQAAPHHLTFGQKAYHLVRRWLVPW